MCSKRCSGLCRKSVENEPLKIFLALSDVDRHREHAAGCRDRGPPGAALSRLMARSIPMFAEAPELSNAPSINSWIPPKAINQINDLGAARRCRRHVPGAGRPVADLLPPGLHRAAGRRHSPVRRSWPVSAKIKNEREVFDGWPQRRQGAAGRHAFARRCFAAGPHDRSAGRRGRLRPTPNRTLNWSRT